MYMRNRDWIIICISCFIAGGVFAGLLIARHDRRQSERIAELERIAADFEQRYADCNQQLRDVCSEIEDYNRRARELTEAMAEQLARDTDNITKTRELVGLLRKEVELLEGNYTNLSNSSSDYNARNK